MSRISVLEGSAYAIPCPHRRCGAAAGEPCAWYDFVTGSMVTDRGPHESRARKARPWWNGYRAGQEAGRAAALAEVIEAVQVLSTGPES